jgi:hypothetical protein
MDDAEVLMKPATTLDDVLKEVRELREEVKAMRNYPIVIRPHPLDALGSVGGKITFGNAG